MAQAMRREPRELGIFHNTPPHLRQSDKWPVGRPTAQNIWTIPREIPQQPGGITAKRPNALSLLAIGQAKTAAPQIDFIPPQLLDLAATTACKTQQACGENGR